MGEVKEYVRTGVKLIVISTVVFTVGYVACYKLAESKYKKEMQELDEEIMAQDQMQTAVRNAKVYGR